MKEQALPGMLTAIILASNALLLDSRLPIGYVGRNSHKDERENVSEWSRLCKEKCVVTISA